MQSIVRSDGGTKRSWKGGKGVRADPGEAIYWAALGVELTGAEVVLAWEAVRGLKILL